MSNGRIYNHIETLKTWAQALIVAGDGGIPITASSKEGRIAADRMNAAAEYIDALQRENAALAAEAMLWKTRAESYDGQIDDRDMEINKLKATVERCRKLLFDWSADADVMVVSADELAERLAAALDGGKERGNE